MRVTCEYGSVSRDQGVKMHHGLIIRGVGLGGRVVVNVRGLAGVRLRALWTTGVCSFRSLCPTVCGCSVVCAVFQCLGSYVSS